MVRGPGIFFRDKVRGPGICQVSPWSQGWAKCAWTKTCTISLIFLLCLWVRCPWGIWGGGRWQSWSESLATPECPFQRLAPPCTELQPGTWCWRIISTSAGPCLRWWTLHGQEQGRQFTVISPGFELFAASPKYLLMFILCWTNDWLNEWLLGTSLWQLLFFTFYLERTKPSKW